MGNTCTFYSWELQTSASGYLEEFVRLHRVHTSPGEYPMPFKGTVRTPSVMSGRGYRPKTVRLESQHHIHFVRRPAGFQLTCGCRKGLQPRLLQPNRVCLCRLCITLTIPDARFGDNVAVVQCNGRRWGPFPYSSSIFI